MGFFRQPEKRHEEGDNTEWSIGLSLGGFERNRLAEADRIESIYSM